MQYITREKIDRFDIDEHILTRNKDGAINCFLCIIYALNEGALTITSFNLYYNNLPNCGVPTKYSIDVTIESIQDEHIKKCKCLNCLAALKQLISKELQKAKLELKNANKAFNNYIRR
jgi:hypothetical protein